MDVDPDPSEDDSLESSDPKNQADIEFDGNTVLCRVCGDRASGFHYGVHACEGCKGFFRRSIQQKIHYRPCLKNQLCLITRVNRNRCQYCRLKKCIAVGMSRDAVRFGRVPKREKAKILEQMQRVNVQCQGSMLDTLLADEGRMCSQIVDVHIRTCMFTRERFRSFFERVWMNPIFVQCSPNVACPLNPLPEISSGGTDGAATFAPVNRWSHFSDCFTAAIRCIVDFARSLPGFHLLSHEDQVTLLKAGTFEVMLVHLACLFDTKSNTMLFTSGKILKRTAFSPAMPAGFLLNSMFDFAERFNELQLNDQEMALFSALIILSVDRPGLRGVDLVDKLQLVISRNLQSAMLTNHAEDPSAFSKLLIKIPDLRTLNTIHSEKVLGLSPAHCDDDVACVSGIQVLNDFKADVSGDPSNAMKREFNEWKMEIKNETFENGVTEDEAGSRQVWPGYRSSRGSDINKNNPNESTVYSSDNANDGLVGRGNCSNDLRLPISPLNDSMHSTFVSKSNNMKTKAPDGPSIACHQTVLSKRPSEMILATPFGTFHRAPLGPWPGKQDLGEPRGTKNAGNSDEEPSTIRGRRKSFSGWMPHRRPAAKQQVRNGQLGIIKKPYNVAKSRASATKSAISLASDSSTTISDGLQRSVLDTSQSESSNKSPNHELVLEVREKIRSEANDLLKTTSAANTTFKTLSADSAGVKWMEQECSSSHQRYMRDLMIIAEERERQKYQSHSNRNSSQSCQSSVDANSERSPSRAFSCSTSASLNDSACSPVSDRSQSAQFEKVDRHSSVTPESTGTHSSSVDLILPRTSVTVRREAYISEDNRQPYYQMPVDHEAMRQTMPLYRAPSMMCEPSSATSTAAAAAAASIFYNQLAIQQQMQFIRHRQQLLVESRCQLGVTMPPVADICALPTPIPWSGAATSSGVATDSRNASVQSDRPSLQRDLHSSRRSPPVGLKPSFD